MKSYFRPAIDAMSGYVPGEQPKMTNLIKLNTNENPYPPSPAVKTAIEQLNWEQLRRYPDPNADELRRKMAKVYGCKVEQIIAGNGSDDILTMIFRAFASPDRPVVCPEPTYSLYPVLAAMQEAPVRKIKLDPEGFTLPADFLEQARGANLLAMARPNAPTGNSFPFEKMREICAGFDGIVLIDEAYADFAENNCMELVQEFDNVIVSRTFSKSYSLAGLRLGCAVANEAIIEGLFKLKDSYNVDRVAQELALAAFSDRDYLRTTVEQIKKSRRHLTGELRKLNFKVINSESNFLFVSPPDGNGEKYFKFLRENAVIVRYFPYESTKHYVRITIGTDAEIAALLNFTGEYLK